MAWLAAADVAQPIFLETVEGERVSLETRIYSPNTLALSVASEDELQPAFRLLSLSESRGLHCLLLVELPADSAVQTAALKRAARAFLKSDFGRRRVLFANGRALPDGAKAALFAPGATEPAWTSGTYPDAAALASPPFVPAE